LAELGDVRRTELSAALLALDERAQNAARALPSGVVSVEEAQVLLGQRDGHIASLQAQLEAMQVQSGCLRRDAARNSVWFMCDRDFAGAPT